MKKLLVCTAALSCASLTLFADDTQDRLQESARVFHEIMMTPDRGIPQDLVDKAYCIVIVPSLKKAAFVVGGEYGKGFAVCRSGRAMGWGAPAAVIVEGGSFGFQIGGSSTDVVMLIRNAHGMRMLDRDKFTLGADASIAAGPVGRTAAASSDASMNAEILSWSRTKGVFAGVALNGASIRPDRDGNEHLYGQKLNSAEILMKPMQPPAAAQPLIADLDHYSWRKS